MKLSPIILEIKTYEEDIEPKTRIMAKGRNRETFKKKNTATHRKAMRSRFLQSRSVRELGLWVKGKCLKTYCGFGLLAKLEACEIFRSLGGRDPNFKALDT